MVQGVIEQITKKRIIHGKTDMTSGKTKKRQTQKKRPWKRKRRKDKKRRILKRKKIELETLTEVNAWEKIFRAINGHLPRVGGKLFREGKIIKDIQEIEGDRKI